MQPALHWLPAAAYVAVIGSAVAARAMGAPPVAVSALAVPVYYLLPLGIGLLLTWPLTESITRTQRGVCAYLLGVIAICGILVAREHAIPAAVDLDWLAAGIVAASLAGLGYSQGFFRWDAQARDFALEYIVVLPMFAVTYWFRFGVLSEYPLTDFFQATHLMKGSLDFGRFDMLNPFTAGSYPPVIPAIEGLLFRFFGFDPLDGFWVLPIASTVLKFSALRTALQPLLSRRVERVVAIAAAAAFMSPFAPTNGELAMLASLVLFALASTAARGTPRALTFVILVTVAAYVAAYFASRASPAIYTAVLVTVCILPIGVGRPGRALFAAVPLVFAAQAIHRSGLLFIPASVLAGVGLSLLVHTRFASRRALRKLLIAASVLTALGAIGVLALLGWLLTHPDEDLRYLEAYRWVLAVALHTVLDNNPEVLVGSGPKVALFELARAMAPSFVIVAVGASLYGGLQASKADAPAAAVDSSQVATAAWALAIALGGVLLLGVPFAYRAGFLAALLLAIALASALRVLSFGANRGRVDMAMLVFAGVYACVLIPLAYGCAPLVQCGALKYGSIVEAFLGALIFLVLVLALVGASSRGTSARSTFARMALCLLFVTEFVANRTYFFPYAYGPPQQTSIVSHLSKEEIVLARDIRSLGANVVLISDPGTMANLRALTGLNSLLTFSNLNMVSVGSDTQLRAWFKSLLRDGGEACTAVRLLATLDGPVSSAEFNYWLARKAWPEKAGVELLDEFGFRDSFVLTADTPAPARSVQSPAQTPSRSVRSIDHAWRARAIKLMVERIGPLTFLVVVNEKTVRWAADRSAAGYYPNVEKIDAAIAERLAAGCDAKIIDGRIVAIRIQVRDGDDFLAPNG